MEEIQGIFRSLIKGKFSLKSESKGKWKRPRVCLEVQIVNGGPYGVKRGGSFRMNGEGQRVNEAGPYW